MKKALVIGLGSILGIGLLVLWWGQYGTTVLEVSETHLNWLAAALMCAAIALWLQLIRTARLMEKASTGQLRSAVLLSHGMNVLLPSLLGDAYEVTAIAKQTQTQARIILLKLIHRFGTTLSALALLMAVAVFSTAPNLGLPILTVGLALPFVIDRALPRISRMLSVDPVAPLGRAQTAFHTTLSVLQHTISAMGVFFLGIAVNDAVNPAAAAAMLSMADLVTYLPVPLGGVGVNHWGVTAVCDMLGRIPVALVALNHGMVVFVGGVSVAIGLATRREAMHNG